MGKTNKKVDDWQDVPVVGQKSEDDIDDWQDVPLTESKKTELESGFRGAAQGVTLGFADELSGVIEALLNKAKGDPEEFGRLYEKYRDESRAAFDKAKKDNPKSYLAGEVGGGVATAFFPGLGAAKLGLGATTARSALTGGAYGLGQSTEDDVAGLAKDAALGAGLGAAGGALGYGIGKGVEKVAQSRVAKKLAEKLGDKSDETAERLAARAIGAERGTIKKFGDEKVREAGRYALDEGIISPLASTEKMAARNEALQRQAGEGMEAVYNAIDDKGASTFTPLDVASKVDEKIGGFWRSPLNRGETNQLENTLEAILMRGDKPIPLSEAQILKQELGKVANWKNAVNVTDKERMAREAYGVVSSAIDDAAEKGSKAVGIDGLVDSLGLNKKLFSQSKTAEELLSNKLAREQGNRLFGLTDAIVGAGGFVAGPMGSIKAVAAKKALERYGLQNAAIAADKISGILRSSPEKFGKFAPVLQRAAQSGVKDLAIVDYALKDNDEYQQTKANLGLLDQ